MEKSTHFVLSRDKNGGYRWKLIGANGESVATGESYKTRRAVVHAVENLKNWANTEKIEEPKVKRVIKKKAAKTTRK